MQLVTSAILLSGTLQRPSVLQVLELFPQQLLYNAQLLHPQPSHIYPPDWFLMSVLAGPTIGVGAFIEVGKIPLDWAAFKNFDVPSI